MKVNNNESNQVLSVYLLQDRGRWDYEETNTVEVYSTFEKALEGYKQRVKDAKSDLREWCDESELLEDENVNKDEFIASYSGYLEGEYDKLHCDIWIEKSIIK